MHCASARISKGQGYQGFLRKRAGSSFGKKMCRTRKNGPNFTPFRVNKMFSHKFQHIEDTSGASLMELVS
jgi:hypothetical protein